MNSQVTAQATCITLSAMSVDRFYVTIYPLQSLRHRTPQMALSVCTTIWICMKIIPISLSRITISMLLIFVWQLFILSYSALVKIKVPIVVKYNFFVSFNTGSLLLSVPIALYQHTESSFWFGPQTYCTEEFPSLIQKRAYILYSFLAVYLLPLITICMCYTFMLKRMGQATVEPVHGCNQVQMWYHGCIMEVNFSM